ncbi:glutamate 5-kinase [Desulforhopalus vacuolatus]|uniref:glutamate 5-kinase n=1 Tax=Desulforhopalus vacuolatus TaxID=40414 RepID=UPI001964753F|nr:glutamate 5-kinase [Desulforhopalus vacuolatus]MBM9519032.1 glutamate 5-kinase [Desulforhopalus vacuolatus]
MDNEENYSRRQPLLNAAKRVVVKAGSAVLTAEDGLDMKVIKGLAHGIASLQDSGREVIFVTSGAVSAGNRKMRFAGSKPLSMRQKQALAAVGQSGLMHDYSEAFALHGKIIAQILLTHSDLASRSRYLNVRNTIHTLLENGIIPILNENDTVSTRELKFSDNDNLAALICNLLEADLYISLTDVAGLFDSNPSLHPEAEPVRLVHEVTPKIFAMCGSSKSTVGTGGMITKVRAAQTVATGGGSSIIASGKEVDVLQRIFKGEEIGTFFMPNSEKMQSRKRWIAWVLKPQGCLTLDAGACRALSEHGKSLLPSGILNVTGDFSEGDAVQCADQSGNVFAVGLTGYNSATVRKIKGRRSAEIRDILDDDHRVEVMHRDNLVLL